MGEGIYSPRRSLSPQRFIENVSAFSVCSLVNNIGLTHTIRRFPGLWKG
jgi:hypothetical protein